MKKKSMTVNSKLLKVLDFRQNYLCDLHLWGERGMDPMLTEIGQLTVPLFKHFHVQQFNFKNAAIELFQRDGAYTVSRGPTFGGFVTIRTEASMQDVTVARLQNTRLRTLLSALF
jgi:hypothetical protein